MKQGMRLLLGIMLLMIILPLHATVQFYKVTNILSHDTLNVRTGPGAKYPILLALPYNARKIEIIETEKGANWVKITVPGTRKLGWVNQHYLKKYDEVPPKGYKCVGTEPFWNMQINADSISISTMEGGQFSLPLALNTGAMNAPPASRVINGKDAQHSVTAFIREGSCSDGMSDQIFDFHIMSLIDSKALSGCCSAIK